MVAREWSSSRINSGRAGREQGCGEYSLRTFLNVKEHILKVALLAALAMLSPLAFSGCAASSTGPASGVPGIGAVPSSDTLAATATVLVTARFNKRPISGVQITLTHKTWPGGKLIAQGKTKLHGSVQLSGNWTNQDLICAGGKYTPSSGAIFEASVCQQPLGARVILDFN